MVKDPTLLPTGSITSDGATKRGPSIDPEAMAFICCLATVFVDVMGQYFSSPVIVPYAASLGANAAGQSLVVSLPYLSLIHI